VNAGVVAAHERGVVTSASLMVRWPAASPAARYARANPRLSVGLHLDFAEWMYRDGEWTAAYETSSPPEEESARQLDKFRQLLGRDPTHIDSHQHVHRTDAFARIASDLAASVEAPLREVDSQVRYCGDFYGQTGKGAPYHDAISVGSLVRLIETLPAGITELACHPAEGIDFETTYGAERIKELRTLCDPRIKAAISSAGVTLCSFSEALAAPKSR
jgi:chitin disaccharide deacetylase